MDLYLLLQHLLPRHQESNSSRLLWLDNYRNYGTGVAREATYNNDGIGMG